MDCFGQMEAINVALVLQEVGDAESGPAADPKCRLIMSSFLTLPDLLDCLICTRNAMSIVLLLQVMGEWDRWGLIDLYEGVVGGTGGGHNLICFFLGFCILLLLVLSPFIF